MSETRLLDNLARALVVPMGRRHALRLLVGAVAAATVPGARPGSAFGAPAVAPASTCGRDVRACPTVVLGASGPDKCCGSPANRWICGGTPAKPECLDACPPPDTACPTGRKDGQGNTEILCCKKPVSLGCCEGECIPNCALLFGRGHTPCCATCCNPGQRCSFSGKSRVCCPVGRTVSRVIAGKKTRFCCPRGTVSVGGDACCPPGDRDCCDEPGPVSGDGDDDLVPLSPYTGRTFCVRGKGRRL